MLVLFDHGTPKGLGRLLIGHTVVTTRARGWDRLSNGELLAEAEKEGFEVLVTTNKNLRYQQNLRERRIAIVVIGNSLWPVLRNYGDSILSAVNAASPRTSAEVEIPR
jgi:hypothetical protein